MSEQINLIDQTTPPSYVREFNAASLSEALEKADEALRIDGVTVAIWKNFMN